MQRSDFKVKEYEGHSLGIVFDISMEWDVSSLSNSVDPFRSQRSLSSLSRVMSPWTKPLMYSGTAGHHARSSSAGKFQSELHGVFLCIRRIILSLCLFNWCSSLRLHSILAILGGDTCGQLGGIRKTTKLPVKPSSCMERTCAHVLATILLLRKAKHALYVHYPAILGADPAVV